MSGLVRIATGVLVGVLLLGPAEARSDWVRDQLYVTLREGPALNHPRVGTLSSGDQVRTLASRDDWTQVKTSEGLSGWMPTKYLQKAAPAVHQLPGIKRELEQARKKISGLQEKVDADAQKLGEFEALQARVLELEEENVAIAGSSRWRILVAGGAIVLLGILIGALVPRARPDKTRRLRF